MVRFQGTYDVQQHTVNWVQTDGYLSAYGSTDLNFGLGGMGNVDISKAGKSNPATIQGSKISLGGNTITASRSGHSITFSPYYELDYEFATQNGTGDEVYTGGIDFNGLLTANVISDMGNFVAYFPAVDSVDSEDDARNTNKISIGKNDVLYSTSYGGTASIGAYLRLGIDAVVSGCTLTSQSPSAVPFCFDGKMLPGVSDEFFNL